MVRSYFIKLLTSALLIATLTGCGFPGVYKINIQQGNIITQDMLDKLKPGMNRKQVHFVLGNPVVQNAFDKSYETYLHTFQKADKEPVKQLITAYFVNDSFTHYEGKIVDNP